MLIGYAVGGTFRLNNEKVVFSSLFYREVSS